MLKTAAHPFPRRRPSNPKNLKEHQAWMKAAESSRLAEINVDDDLTLPPAVAAFLMICKIDHLLPEGSTRIVRRGGLTEVHFDHKRGHWAPRGRGKDLLDLLPRRLARSLAKAQTARKAV